jgi:beta-1,4-mannosyltransferase
VLLSRYSIINNSVQYLINELKIFWLISLPYVIFNLAGLLLGPPKKPNPKPNLKLTGHYTLRISYCTKGDNCLSLRRSLQSVERAVQHELTLNQKNISCGSFLNKIEVEVITDKKIPRKVFPADLHVHEIVVPAGYTPPNKTLFKARSIQYSLQVNKASENIFTLRLDEESCINYLTILGIIEFLQNKEKSQVIAQGEILYNSYQYANAISLTAADAIRSGDDLGRFRLQYLFKQAYFGMHGSFVLIRSDVEKMIGYDHGPSVAITEDAYLAMQIIDHNYHFGWLNGNIFEQSPYTYKDFIKQRKRWFVGLKNVVKDRRIRWKNKIVLLISILLWSVSWVAFAVTLLNFVLPSETNIFVGMAGGFVFSVYVLIYIIGTYRNSHTKNLSPLAKAYLYLLTIICIPFSTLLEAVGVIEGILQPEKRFEIINKN